MTGAFFVEWDEDPICEDIGRIDLTEDGGESSFHSLNDVAMTATQTMI